MILIGTSDILFFYFALYIAYQFEVCQYLVATFGENDERHDNKLLRRVAALHSDLCKYFIFINSITNVKHKLILDFANCVREHFNG